MTLQQDIAADLGVRPDVDPAAEIDRRVGFLVDYLRHTGAMGYVLGISGGQDSSWRSMPSWATNSAANTASSMS